MRNEWYGLLINEERLPAFLEQKQKTFIISGAARGGTSLLPYCLRRGGVHFGDAGPYNHEPPLLVKKGYSLRRTLSWIDELRKDHDVVGVKYPGFWQDLANVSNRPPNAMLMYIFRNPLSNTKTIVKNDPRRSFDNRSLRFSIEHSFMNYMSFAKKIHKIKVPVLAMSYELIQNNPTRLVELLEGFGLEFDDRDDVAQKIAVPGYKQIPEA